jgi:hypothetical protein
VKRRVLLLACLPHAVAAQEVWRCGPGGRHYAQSPCPGGQRIDIPAPRPPEDVQAAREAALREAATADRLRRERLAFEAPYRGNGLVAITSEPAPVRPGRAAPPRRPRRQRPQQHSAAADT